MSRSNGHQAETAEDLRQILTSFWLGAMEQASEFSDRIKSSELLAKYILGEGTTPVQRRRALKPSTADVLKLAAQLERGEKRGS